MPLHHLNIGRGLMRPYESRYSILRRFLIANPGSTRSNIEIDSKIKLNRNPHFIEYLVKLSYKHIPEYLNLITKRDLSLDNLNIEKHCPRCASNFYHTDLYRLSWLSTCPLHRIPLTKYCPKCGEKWPTWNELFSRKCSCCARPKPAKTTFLDDREFAAISMLFDFISYEIKDDIYLASSWSLPIRRSLIDIEHPDFPSYQVLRHPRILKSDLSKVGIDTFSLKTKMIHIQATPLPSNTSTSSCGEAHSWAAKIRYLVINEIHSKIKQKTSKKHNLRVFDYARLKPIFINNKLRLCPYCVSYSIWFYMVSSFPYEYRYNPDRFGNGLYGSRRYDSLQKISPMDHFVENNIRYKTDIKFQMWLYKLDLQSSFCNIFSYITQALETPDMVRHHTGFNGKLKPESDPIRHIERSIFFYASPNKNEVQLHYIEDELLSQFSIPRIKGALSNCDSFRVSIKEMLFMEPGQGFERPAIENGLTYDQCLILEHGFHKFHTGEACSSSFTSKSL